ncbi:MAG: sigma-70 family RNA polymerase sigma factor [Bacteroidales bacterium]|nr:sigma-70 family RNA polymerase sigma factor [Bacteroidales bacterium]
MIRFFPKDAEAQLVRKAKSGDTAAVKSIYDNNVRYLSAVCRRYVPDDDELKDVLQEAFIKIFSNLDKFEYKGSGSLRGWMSRIVVNEALMFLRRSSKHPLLSLDDPLPDIPETEDPDVDGIPPQVLQSMVEELPPGCRTVLNLFVFEQKSHKEIAEMLGIRENSSTSQFHRAKTLLAGMIKQYRNEQGLDR